MPIWYMKVKNKSWFFYNMVTSRNGNSSGDAGSLSGLSTQWDQISRIRQNKDKSIDLTYAWESLTDFENDANVMTGNYLCKYAETCLEKIVKLFQGN